MTLNTESVSSGRRYYSTYYGKGFKNDMKRYLRALAPFLALLVFTSASAGAFLYVESEVICDKHGTNETIDYWDAFHFIFTCETSIGYGDISPCTVTGRILVLIFTIIGLPLTLICLGRLGRWLERMITDAWILIIHIFTCKEPVPIKSTKESEEDYIDVPMMFAIFLTLIWTLISSCYFYFTLIPTQATDDRIRWDFFQAIYMTLITFLTVGLGDVTPNRHGFVLINIVFIIIGLAFVTMCITMIQTKMDRAFDNAEEMIRNDLKAKLRELAPGQTLGENDEDIDREIRKLIKKAGHGWLIALMSDNSMAKLINQFKIGQHLVNEETQTVQKEYADIGLTTNIHFGGHRLSILPKKAMKEDEDNDHDGRPPWKTF